MKKEYEYPEIRQISSETTKNRCPLCGGNIINTSATRNRQERPFSYPERPYPEISAEWNCVNCNAVFSADFRVVNGSAETFRENVNIEFETETIKPSGEIISPFRKGLF